MKTKIFKLIFLLAIILIVSKVEASTVCNFARDLELGAEGEDVRCLQKYLNSTNHKIALSGVGSSGHETNTFRDLTEKAVISWQLANGISPAKGHWGPKSITKYEALVKNISPSSTVPSTTSTTTGLPDGCTSTTKYSIKTGIKCQPDEIEEVDQVTTVVSDTNQEQKAINRIKEALKMLRDADDQIDEGEGDQAQAKANYDDAKEDLLDAVKAYFSDKDYVEAYDLADDAYKNAEDAFDDAGGESREDEVESILDEADNDVANAKRQIKIADNNDKDVDKSEGILENAENKLDEAWNAFDDEDFDLAEELADEASSLADDAVDAIDENDDRDEAKDVIDEAKDAIDDAEDEISEAEDDGDDVSDAEDLLDEAKDKLDDAENEYDDENYDDAIDLANDAIDLANDAIDAL